MGEGSGGRGLCGELSVRWVDELTPRSGDAAPSKRNHAARRVDLHRAESSFLLRVVDLVVTHTRSDALARTQILLCRQELTLRYTCKALS